MAGVAEAVEATLATTATAEGMMVANTAATEAGTGVATEAATRATTGEAVTLVKDATRTRGSHWKDTQRAVRATVWYRTHTLTI